MISLRVCLWTALAGWLVLWAPGHAADAPPDEGAGAKAARKAKKPHAARPPRLVAPEGSGETAAARAARLKRECKGRPNAGACSGHTD